MFAHKPYQKRYRWVPLSRISPDLQHAVLAAEDTRFYQHHGFDWVEIQKAIDDEDEDSPARGASTLTQQLVKNLVLTTRRSFIRKGVEASLVPVAEAALGKQRILELYLNVVEWGPGFTAPRRPRSTTSTRMPQRSIGIGLPGLRRSCRTRFAGSRRTWSRRAGVILTRMRQMGW